MPRGRLNSELLEHIQQLDDEQIVAIAQKQLPYVTIAYEVLICRYQDTLMKVCVRYLQKKEDAEDTVHEVMLKVFHHLKSFNHQSSFKTWVYRIAFNESMDLIRRRKKATLVSIDSYPIDDSLINNEELEDDNSSCDSIDQQLRKLDLIDRTIISFRIMGELEFKEIAEIVELKLSAVKMRYQRALNKLRLRDDDCS